MPTDEPDHWLDELQDADFGEDQSYLTCHHEWVTMFGPVLKCRLCHADTILSFGGESKPIYQQPADQLQPA